MVCRLCIIMGIRVRDISLLGKSIALIFLELGLRERTDLK